MTEEKALRLFAQCYNRKDFSEIVRHLDKAACYESWDNLYRFTNRQGVANALEHKADLLRQTVPANRAHMGFMKVRKEFGGFRYEPCVVLTRDDVWQTIGLVRIKVSWRKIRCIQVQESGGIDYTRGDYIQ